MATNGSARLSRLLSDHGMLLVLLMLGIFFSWKTLETQHPSGAEAGRQAALAVPSTDGLVLLLTGLGDAEAAFAEEAARTLHERGVGRVITHKGSPGELRRVLAEAAATAPVPAALVVDEKSAGLRFLQERATLFPPLADVPVMAPAPYRWPNFLKSDNLLNVANQIVVIAVLAIGVSMAILTGGIDLSVGSLVALSAVVATLTIRRYGGEEAGTVGMVVGSLCGVGACCLVGLATGALVAWPRVPPFIVTLGMMLVASGLAYILAKGESIYQIPPSYTWLGRGYVRGIPVSVLLMIALYAAAHFVMHRTVLGRYIYAVGGNPEAARLSGVPVAFVLIAVYTLSGFFAGLGGIVTASQLRSGSPQYGQMYELCAIAAVVVGGTSLAGGEGRILGTLVGALVIAVIQNGMNLTGVESYTQKVVFGLVILGAVAIDTMRKQGRLEFPSLRRKPEGAPSP